MGVVPALIANVVERIRREFRGAKFDELKVEVTPSETAQAESFLDPGVDATPLKDDKLVVLFHRRPGGVAAVGHLDPRNAGTTEPGERRTYSRDEDGEVVSEILQNKDGTIIIRNDKCSFTLKPDGTIILKNQTTTTTTQTDGVTVFDNDIVVQGIRFLTHGHTNVVNGPSVSGDPVN